MKEYSLKNSPSGKQKSKEVLIGRLKKRSLDQTLLSKFLNEYGYEKGKVAAQALVRDIITTINGYYAQANLLCPGEILWSAVLKDERQGQGKTLDNTERKLVKLTLFAAEDLELLKNNKSCYRDIQKQRVVRLIKESYEQKAVLTEDDLLILLAINRATISKWIAEYQEEKNELLPIRGNVADIRPGLTHKKQIIKLYAQGMLNPEIARATNHSRQAVDRYIADFERIKILKERNFNAEEISRIAKRGIKVVKEYLKIIK